MHLKDYIKMDWNIWYLRIKVSPNAKQTEFCWPMDNDVLKFRLKAIPEKWKANNELVDFISKILWVKKSTVKVISWLTDKNKLVKIDF